MEKDVLAKRTLPEPNNFLNHIDKFKIVRSAHALRRRDCPGLLELAAW